MPRNLRQMIAELKTPHKIIGSVDVDINNICVDSRQLGKADAFICISGNRFDGHNYIPDAVNRGVSVIFTEKDVDVPSGTTVVRTADNREALAEMAALYFGRPADRLYMIGVTGTNGKTTVSFMISSILKASGCIPGVIGTTGYYFSGRSEELLNTTPDPLIIQRILADMLDAGVTHVVMEVSSHGLVQKRTHDIPFSRALFTNLTQDHLDYHGSMDEYARAKGILFDEAVKAGKSGFQALGSFDDPYTSLVIRDIPYATFGLADGADFRATDINCTADGSDFILVSPEEKIDIHLNLIGLFNVRNALAAASTALSMGISHEAVKSGLENLPSVPGRLEGIRSDSGFSVIVDYAHTPDALTNVLSALRPLAKGRLITVYGCGGDRDFQKRPLMSKAVAEYSDFAVLTNDNPRSEEPMTIAAQAEKGLIESRLTEEGYRIVLDRKEAISFALNSADIDDIVLIAGKGHENYQEIKGVRHPFDDRAVVRGILKDNGYHVY